MGPDSSCLALTKAECVCNCSTALTLVQSKQLSVCFTSPTTVLIAHTEHWCLLCVFKLHMSSSGTFSLVCYAALNSPTRLMSCWLKGPRCRRYSVGCEGLVHANQNKELGQLTNKVLASHVTVAT